MRKPLNQSTAKPRRCADSLLYRDAVAKATGAEEQGIDAPRDTGSGRNRLNDQDVLQGLEADGRDDAAHERDASADARDRRADARDTHADVRDTEMSDEADSAATRRFAKQDRRASAEDREKAGENRQHASDDRQASRDDRSLAEHVKARLIAALDDADKLPETTLLIGQAQGMLMSSLGGNATEAIIELGDRADRDQVGLQEAARRILAEGATTGTPGMPVPGLS